MPFIRSLRRLRNAGVSMAFCRGSESWSGYDRVHIAYGLPCTRVVGQAGTRDNHVHPSSYRVLGPLYDADCTLAKPATKMTRVSGAFLWARYLKATPL